MGWYYSVVEFCGYVTAVIPLWSVVMVLVVRMRLSVRWRIGCRFWVIVVLGLQRLNGVENFYESSFGIGLSARIWG